MKAPLFDRAGRSKSWRLARHGCRTNISSKGADDMRFMMLIHHDEAALAAAPQKELWADYGAFNQALAKAEGSSSGVRLQPSSAATTVRQHDGKTDVLDGPYADTKEQFAG